MAAVALDLSVDRQVEVEQFPGGFQDHGNAVSGVGDEVAEDDSQALQSVLLHVEETAGRSLENLQKQRHPRVESLRETLFNEFIVYSISPRNGPEAEVEDFEDLLSAMGIDFVVCESGEKTREKLGDKLIKLFDCRLLL